MSVETPDSGAKFATYRRIAESLRDQILNSEFTPGQRLPSKGKLMEEWHASSFTIHSALQTLIKEGWIQSVRGSGTYVAQPNDRFISAGIYHSRDICSESETPFARRVHVALLEKFRELGKSTQVFMDTRPTDDQTTLLPSLADAIFPPPHPVPGLSAGHQGQSAGPQPPDDAHLDAELPRSQRDQLRYRKSLQGKRSPPGFRRLPHGGSAQHVLRGYCRRAPAIRFLTFFAREPAPPACR